MSYNATVHQPTDVLHTANRGGAIRVWYVTEDGTPAPVEHPPTDQPDPSPALEFTLEEPTEQTTAEYLARAAGIALPTGGAR